MFLMPVGLLIFAWTAQAEIHWIAPQIGMAFVAIGLMLAFNSIQNLSAPLFRSPENQNSSDTLVA